MIFDIYSRRVKKLRGASPDVYKYDDIPTELRVQIVHIWHDTLGGPQEVVSNLDAHQAYEAIARILRREYGVFQLRSTAKFPTHGNLRPYEELTGFLLCETIVERVLDAIEVSSIFIKEATSSYDYLQRRDAAVWATKAIEELNGRFREHGVGYQLEQGQILRMDSHVVHDEVIKPALSLLSAPGYAGGQAEFLNAHKHYRHGRYKEALNECLKAFESVMKAICDKRSWTYDANGTAKTLIQRLFDEQLIPAFWQTHFSGLRSTLEGGIPTARNRMGAHGQGAQVTDVPQYLVAYVLHQTAAAIVFLAEAERAFSPR